MIVVKYLESYFIGFFFKFYFRFICLGLEIIKCNLKIVVVSVIYVIDLNV